MTETETLFARMVYRGTLLQGEASDQGKAREMKNPKPTRPAPAQGAGLRPPASKALLDSAAAAAAAAAAAKATAALKGDRRRPPPSEVRQCRHAPGRRSSTPSEHRVGLALPGPAEAVKALAKHLDKEATAPPRRGRPLETQPGGRSGSRTDLQALPAAAPRSEDGPATHQADVLVMSALSPQRTHRAVKRVTTPLRVYTRRSHRRVASPDANSRASTNSTGASPPRSSEEESDAVVVVEPSAQGSPVATPLKVTPKSKFQEAEEDLIFIQGPRRKRPKATDNHETADAEPRLVATPQRRSSLSTESARLAATAANAEADAGGEVPAPPSPTSVQRSCAGESCGICCEDVLPGSAVRLSCRHGWYCTQCLEKHAQARLEIGSVDVCCPECNTSIAERTLRQVLPASLVERLLKRSLEQAVSAAQDIYPCPTPNCSFRVALEDGDVPRLKCPDCKKTCCLRCQVQPWHRGKTCEEAAALRRASDKDDAALKRWMTATGSKRCPTCQAVVSKQNLEKQGTQYVECHKMMCRNCETKFCFKCLATLSDQFSCSCSRKEHGFINPKTGRRVNHIKPTATKKKKR